MKKGTIMLILISVAYAVTLTQIMAEGINPEKDYVGAKALRIQQQYLVGKQVQLYLDQSVRNAMYAAAQEMHSLSSEEKQCPEINGVQTLFAKDSCKITEELLKEIYLQHFKKYFATYLSKEKYGVQFIDKENNYEYTLQIKENTVEIIGKAKKHLHYTGNDVTYSFNPSFRENIPFALQKQLKISTLLEKSLSCIGNNLETFKEKCTLDKIYTWTSKQEQEHLVLTAKEKAHEHAKTNIAISFAINLKTLQDAKGTLFT